MTTRRAFLFSTLLALAGLPAAARAQGSDIEAQILSELGDQGFQQIRVGTTLLGRRRVLATNADGSREIIFNPRTGEILRDAWLTGRPSSRDRILDRDEGGSSRSGGNSGGRRDDGGRDNSGSGSSNSGSGSSGSGGGNSGSGGSGGGGGKDDDGGDDDRNDDHGGSSGSGGGGSDDGGKDDDKDDDKH